ncbi:hypothetical protein F4604DRAFT_1675910 [Suillus subluteus]|nr:hypothetical protein F4604DRAFT_1675910 [Suillus subluteus]
MKHTAKTFMKEGKPAPHSFSKHPKALDPMRDAPQKQDGAAPSGKNQLVSIFKEKISSGSGARSLLTATSSKSMLNQKTEAEQARDEVMNGYRTGLNSQNSKVNKARAASQFNLEDKVVKVASWLLLVNNLDSTYQYLQNEVFPLAFGYVNSTEMGKGIGIPSCPWVLISKERLRYEVVNIDKPTSSRPKCPVKDANVIIAAAKLKHGRQSSLSIEILSDKEHKPPIKKLKVGIMVKQEDLVSDFQAQTQSVVDAASQQPKKYFLESSNADIDELPNVI